MTVEFFSNKKRLFDRWASSYDWLFPSVIYQAIHKRLLEYVDLAEDSNILDMGCGTGRLFQRLGSEFPDVRGTGLDLSPQMLHKARVSDRHHPRFIYIESPIASKKKEVRSHLP
uniref:class I SAM-dependent DNA methyltransferase n=1 Tax=Nodularia chucula TaxID=3093667 RepID=UPI0039C72F2D